MSGDRKSPAIVMGDLRTIIRYGAKPMKNRNEWAQKDSDTLAHFIHVVSLINGSNWSKSKVRFDISHEASADLPSHEASIFAAVYFRQLLGGDNLLDKALETYERFCSSQIRWHWIASERDDAKSLWNCPPIEFVVSSNILNVASPIVPTLNDLFDAFLYGALALHFSKVDPAHVARLRALEI